MAKKPKAPKPKPEPNAEAIAKVEASKRAARLPVRIGSPVGVPKRNAELEEKFLAQLRESWSISKSAAHAGLAPKTVYEWRSRSAATYDEDTGQYSDDFCVRWEEAQRVGVESLEDEAIRRAKQGVEKPVYQGGVLVGSVTEYSDTLMGLVLRGKNPAVYNTERHEHTGKDGQPMEMNMTLTFVKSGQKK